MASDPAVRLSPIALEKAQLCVKAAELRARHMRYGDIAKELGLGSPMAAKEAAKQGASLIPADDVREVRRYVAEELHWLARDAVALIEDPGPMATVSGKIVIDDATGEPYADKRVRVQAQSNLLAINKELRKLYGTDAPRQAVSWSVTASPEEIRAEAAAVLAQAKAAEEETALRVIPGSVEDAD